MASNESINSKPESQSWFNELPEEIKRSVDKGLKDFKEGKIIPHEKVKEQYQKWLDLSE